MGKHAAIKNVDTEPFPGHTIREICNSDHFPDSKIMNADRIFMLCGTVNLLNMAQDAINHPYKFVRSVKTILQEDSDIDFCDYLARSPNLRISIEFFNRHFSHHIVNNMLSQYKLLWKKIKTLKPTILLISVSILPIPLYFSFLDKTNIAINQAVRKIFSSKPNHIYIPLSSAFLSTPTPSNP